MLSIRVISGSAAIIASHARFTASPNALGSSARSLMACGAPAGRNCPVLTCSPDATGGLVDAHFHPGTSGFSSSKERIRSADGAEGSEPSGNWSNVMENPAMFKLVYPIVNTTPISSENRHIP